MEEIWRDVEEFEGIYQVSNLGRVKALKRLVNKTKETKVLRQERILRPGKNNCGYMNVMLCVDKKHKTISIHQLVARAFLENKENKRCVNHIDGDKTNNNLTNLERCTHSENSKHAFRIGIKKSVDYSGKEKRKVLCKELNIIFNSLHEASRQMNLSVGYLCTCLKTNKIYKNYHWEYVND